MRPTIRSLLAALAACTLASLAHAAYPERPIRLVVPTTAGGGADTLARTIAAQLNQRLGWSAVAENRPGANGIIGVDLVAKAPADGYTLLFAFADHFVNPSLYPSLPFDMARDLAPIAYVGALPFVLVVNPSLPVRTTAELIALAKAKPKELNFASVGTGGMVHMTMELFKIGAGIDLTHVPYKGSSAALPDIISGRIQTMFTSAISAKPYVDAGQVRMLGLSALKRSPELPNLPTISEGGVPGFQVEIWYGVLAPAKTPPEIVGRLNAEINAILATAEFRTSMTRQGIVVATPGTPEEFGAFTRAEMAKWAKVVKQADIKVGN